MLHLWREILSLWRGMLDETGFWPSDLIGKTACAGMSMLVVCLGAHFAPFTIEAFFATLMAGALLVLAMLIVMGIGVGVLGAIMVFMDRRAVVEAAEAARLRQTTAGQEGAVVRMHGVAAPAPESVGLAGDCDQLEHELRCHDDP